MSTNSEILDYRRYRVINKVTILIALVNLFHGIIWLYMEAYKVGFVAVITSFLMLATLLIKRSINTTSLKANLNIGLLSISLTLSSLITYQSSELVIFWIFVLTLGSLLFVDKEWFYFWLSLHVISITTTPFLSKIFPYTDTFSATYLPYVKLIQIVGLLIANSILAFLYRNLIFNTIQILSNKKAKLSKKSRDLREIQKYKNQFFANMGHDLRTPMNAIMGIVDLLNQKKDHDHELLEYLRNSSNHLLSVINDLMDFSKIQEKKLELNDVDFDLIDSIQSTYNLVKIMALEKQQIYNITIDPNLPKFVIGDPRRINQIIVNVLTNAIKYTPEKGEINFHCFINSDITPQYADQVSIGFTITDTGMGISKEDMKYIFKDYFRGEAARIKNISGTGLGLFITKYLVDAMGGDILIQSDIDKGTQVDINILFRTTKAEKTNTYHKVSDAISFNKPLNLLLVDDNKLNLLIAEKQLQRIIPSRSSIFTALNGQEAVELFKENDIDIILMDMEMPIMDGVEATSIIRHLENTKTKTIPIIIITANLGTRDTSPCIKSGADAIIGKPFKLQNLSQTMQKLLVEYN